VLRHVGTSDALVVSEVRRPYAAVIDYSRTIQGRHERHSRSTRQTFATIKYSSIFTSCRQATSVEEKGDTSLTITYQMNLRLADLANECSRNRSVPKAQQALKLLRSLDFPDSVAYNSVIKAFAKVSPYSLNDDVSYAATQAELLLREMQRLNAEQRLANQNWYGALSDGLLREEEVSQGPPIVRVKPNIRSFCTVMDAYARIGTRSSAKKVELLLQELQSAYDMTGDGALKPNLVAYNTLLAAWSKVGGEVAADRCREIITNEMPLAPDVISYNAALHAIAKSGLPDAGERAEALLRSMGDPQEKDVNVVQPNGRSYTTCMDAWSQCGRPDKAEELLYEMKELFLTTQDKAFRPNCVTYATVIHGYALSKDPEKTTKAYALFQNMIEDGIEPNKVTYNNLLNCCASSATRPELIKLVEDLYLQMLERRNPDQYTFGTVLKACSNLLWKDKDFAPSVFREACRRGQVSGGVLWQFRQAVPIDTYREIVGSDDFRYDNLPSEWTHNVRQDRWR